MMVAEERRPVRVKQASAAESQREIGEMLEALKREIEESFAAHRLTVASMIEEGLAGQSSPDEIYKSLAAHRLTVASMIEEGLANRSSADEIAQIDKRVSQLRSSAEEREQVRDSELQSFRRELTELNKRLNFIENRSVGLDLASVARQLRPLWRGGSAMERREREVEVEHGHALLMSVLVDIEKEEPGWLSGKSLVEIGMTRELWHDQRSTQKLAFFSMLMDMRFISVDMDPENVARTKEWLHLMNPGAMAVEQPGEHFLRKHSTDISVLYLDAFDFDHGKHSTKRKKSYERNLNTTITDEECWEMHLACARSAERLMQNGSVVAFDDTWTDGSGELQGKGKLAVPYLLGKGFLQIARSEMTICLRRKTERA